jgi:hypothetical protein
VFPEALLQQILKSMVHPDTDTRVGAHHIFSAVIVRGPSHQRGDSEYLYETKKWQSRATSVFASATALLEKLRREKECSSSDKPGNTMHDDGKERNMNEEDNKHVWARKSPAYFSKLVFSFVDRWAALTNSAEVPPAPAPRVFLYDSPALVPCSFLAMFILRKVIMYLPGNQDHHSD